jgi:hypothetical protein
MAVTSPGPRDHSTPVEEHLRLPSSRAVISQTVRNVFQTSHIAISDRSSKNTDGPTPPTRRSPLRPRSAPASAAAPTRPMIPGSILPRTWEPSRVEYRTVGDEVMVNTSSTGGPAKLLMMTGRERPRRLLFGRSPNVAKIGRRSSKRINQVSSGGGKTPDVAGNGWSQVQLSEFIKRNKGWSKTFFELRWLGRAVAVGAGEDDLNEMMTGIPTRGLKHESYSFRRNL